jgi:hypothetical protein
MDFIKHTGVDSMASLIKALSAAIERAMDAFEEPVLCPAEGGREPCRAVIARAKEATEVGPKRGGERPKRIAHRPYDICAFEMSRRVRNNRKPANRTAADHSREAVDVASNLVLLT